MWAYSLTEPAKFSRVEVNPPGEGDLKEGQVLIRTLAGAVCGSDLGYFAGHPDTRPQDRGPYAANFPGYPMHEVVGEVLASRSPLYARGAHVVGWAEYDNAVSEIIVTDGDQVVQVDEDLEPVLAIPIQTLACVIYAVDQIGDVEGHSVAVLGQGSIGMLFSHVLKSRGASHVTGVDLVDRSDFAADFGVDEAIHGSVERWVSQLSEADRPSVVVEAIGHQAFTISDAIDAVAPGGRLYYFGIPETRPVAFDLYKFLRKQLTLKAGSTLSRHHALEVALEHVKANEFLPERYVTHVFDVEDVQQAYETAIVPARGRLKVAVRMA
ncbi:MAG: zinc-binding dehydrogenase [Acidimicrobiaceae bacterium]|nr:zinc-binding dehydrogenase [Acidimicrobiaceae bacterium]